MAIFFDRAINVKISVTIRTYRIADLMKLVTTQHSEKNNMFHNKDVIP